MSFDSETARLIDRIQATAFYQAKLALIKDKSPGANVISIAWVAKKLRRSKHWVKDNWKKKPEDCFADFSECGRPEILSQESKNIIEQSYCHQRGSCRELAKEILAKRGKKRSQMAIHRFVRKSGRRPFHSISKPLKTDLNRENRLFLADFVKDYDEGDFLNFAFSDEFFIYAIRKPNHQNDRVWALDVGEIEDSERYRSVVKNPTCIGLFLMFTAKRLLWVIKDEGQSWNGAYFRETVLLEKVVSFLNDENNVVSVGETTFVHDRAPCMKANATQLLLREQGLKFWGNEMWPGNSPDLNPTENLGEIVKDRVERLMLLEQGRGRYSKETLRRNLDSVLAELEFDQELFENLLCSMPRRFQQVRNSNGGETEY